MLGRQRPGKLKSRRVVHKSTGGMLNPIPAPVDPVGNAPSSSLNTVAHPRVTAVAKKTATAAPLALSRERARDLRSDPRSRDPSTSFALLPSVSDCVEVQVVDARVVGRA